MPNKPSETGPSSALIYWCALLLVVFPLLSLANAWPPAPSSPEWRFAVVGLLAGASLLPTVGLVVASLAARAFGHRGLLAAVSIAALVTALVVIVAAVGFALDATQLHGLVGVARRGRFDRDVSMAVAQLALAAVTGMWVAVGGLREVRRTAGARRHRAAPTPMPVIGGASRNGAREAVPAATPVAAAGTPVAATTPHQQRA